ncbi:MAG: hypothetical protein HY879_22715 [Deltaproteobacteria bacterium]|nr:hypothetical protein [Deltaproteobacteria bacterium]
MRCPNCGYVSFDYSVQCPKCKADLSAQRLLLNLPEIRPNPISIQEILERMPLIAQKEAGRERVMETVRTQAPNVPEPAKKDPGPKLSLEDFDLFPIDPGRAPQGSKGPETEEEGLKLFLEDLEISPAPKKDH